MALIDKLTAIGDAIRSRVGNTNKMTLDEMADTIESMNPDSTDSQTYMLIDENGYEIPAVLVDEEVELTATANDIREGVVAVTDDGVITGEKFIPSYYTSVGTRAIPNGSSYTLKLENRNAYDYTSFQCIICSFNTSLSDSVSAEKVVINDKVYQSNSDIALSTLTKDSTNKTVEFGIINDSGSPCIIRYFTYKEEEQMNNIEPRLAYNYAEIDLDTNMCLGVHTTGYDASTNTGWVEIPVYDEEYIFKYYINGNWYEDAEGTIPWTSSLL